VKVDRYVDKNMQAGDALAFFPPWLAGYARDHNRFGGLTGVRENEIFGDDLKPFTRVWIVDCFGSFDANKMSGYGLLMEKTLDGITARLYQRDGAQVSWRLSDRLAQVGVSLRGKQGFFPLAYEESGMALPSGERLRPARSEFRSLPKSGVEVPLRKGADIRFDLGELPPGELLFCGGITDGGLFAKDYSPIMIGLKSGGRTVSEVTFAAKSGWYCRSLPRIDATELSLSLSSANRSKKRSFLIDLLVI
jgi:hypothetical protein